MDRSMASGCQGLIQGMHYFNLGFWLTILILVSVILLCLAAHYGFKQLYEFGHWS